MFTLFSFLITITILLRLESDPLYRAQLEHYHAAYPVPVSYPGLLDQLLPRPPGQAPRPHPPAPAAKGSKHGSGNANAPPSSRIPGWEGPVSTITITSVSLSPLVLVITLTTTTGRDVLQHPSVLMICTIYNFLH